MLKKRNVDLIRTRATGWIVALAAAFACDAAAAAVINSSPEAAPIAMPVTLLENLQTLLRMGPAATGEAYSTFISMLTLDPKTDSDRAVAGHLYGRLPPDFGIRLDQALQRGDSPAVLRGTYQEGVERYHEAAREAAWTLASEAAQITANNAGMPPGHMWRQYRTRRLYAFYGAEAAKHVDSMRNLARNTAGLLAPSPAQTPLEAVFDAALRERGLVRRTWDGTRQEVERAGSFINQIRCNELGGRPKPFSYSSMLEKFGDSRGKLIVLQDRRSGEIEGTTAYYTRQNSRIPRGGTAKMELVYLARNLRGIHLDGRRLSIGRALVLLTMLEASRGGYDSMFLRTVYARMYPAFRLYARLGFLPPAWGTEEEYTPEERAKQVSPRQMVLMIRDILPNALKEDFPREFGS